MNISLATWYGTAGSVKVSGVDAAEVHAVRRLWLSLHRDLTKVSSPTAITAEALALVESLGGAQEAKLKLSQAREWLEAWDRGEQRGKSLAEELVKLEYAKARSQHRGDHYV